eukprot:3603132-Amphidinium_carterae.1
MCSDCPLPVPSTNWTMRAAKTMLSELVQEQTKIIWNKFVSAKYRLAMCPRQKRSSFISALVSGQTGISTSALSIEQGTWKAGTTTCR